MEEAQEPRSASGFIVGGIGVALVAMIFSPIVAIIGVFAFLSGRESSTSLGKLILGWVGASAGLAVLSTVIGLFSLFARWAIEAANGGYGSPDVEILSMAFSALKLFLGIVVVGAAGSAIGRRAQGS